MRWVVVAAVILTVGCMDASDNPDPSPDPTADPKPGASEPFERPVDYSVCDGIEVVGSLSGAAARPHVPQDFDVPENALFALGGFRCGPEGDLVGRGFFAVQVTPSDERLLSARATNYFWMPEHYVDAESAIASALDETHATWTAASVDASVDALGSAFALESANTTYRFSAPAAGPSGTSGLAAEFLVPFREYFRADGGYAYIDARFGGGEGVTGVAPGTLDASGDGIAVGLLGASSTRPAIMMDQLEYADAVIGYVPWPPAGNPDATRT